MRPFALPHLISSAVASVKLSQCAPSLLDSRLLGARG